MKMSVTITVAIVSVIVATQSSAQDSIQERLQLATSLQSRIADLQTQVEKTPDDRALFKTFLEVGLQYYELTIRFKFSEPVRSEILELKIAMQDMYSIQHAVAELRRPTGTDEDQLKNLLKSRKMPQSFKRSVPLVDPWGTPYRIFVQPETGQFKIVSAGRSKKFDTREFGIADVNYLIRSVERRNSSLNDNIVFIDGANFTRIFDYPKEAQTFLYTLCEPADEVRPTRCW